MFILVYIPENTDVKFGFLTTDTYLFVLDNIDLRVWFPATQLVDFGFNNV